MLLSLGLAWMIREMGADLSWQTILACGIASLGFGMMATPKAGHGLRLVLVGVVLTVVLAASSVEHSGSMRFGDKTVVATSISEVEREYEQGVGDLVLDLSGVEFPAGTTAVAINVGMGDVTVRVPDDVQVRLQAEMGMGDIQVFNREVADGIGIKRHFTSEGGDPGRELFITVNVGLGDIDIQRATFGRIELPGPPSAPQLELDPPAAQVRT